MRQERANQDAEESRGRWDENQENEVSESQRTASREGGSNRLGQIPPKVERDEDKEGSVGSEIMAGTGDQQCPWRGADGGPAGGG